MEPGGRLETVRVKKKSHVHAGMKKTSMKQDSLRWENASA